MCKKGYTFLLSVLLLLSLTACSGTSQEITRSTDPVQTIKTTTAPTESTLSAEEILIASLPDKVREAYDLGLVELTLLEDLNRICLGTDAAKIIQNIHIRHHGVESRIMNQLLESDHADIAVTRYWLAQTMFVAEAEFLTEAPSENYLENIDYMLDHTEDETFWAYFYPSENNIIHTNDNPNCCFSEYESDIFIGSASAYPPDWDTAWNMDGAWYSEDGEPYIDYSATNPTLPYWVVYAFDRLTGEKIMPADTENPFLPREKMTVQEVVETALRYHNWIPPLPEMLPYEEIPTYDTSIITDDLLTRETTLPEASCQSLPASWRGVAVHSSNASLMTDLMLQENEIQVIQDAGFNHLQLHLDFRYYSSEDYTAWPGWATEPSKNYMNESRLKELDQIIAWCMERDIHVNLVCKAFVGWNDLMPPTVNFANTSNSRSLAQQWTVLARRYAAIPNTYLSYTMFNRPPIITDGEYRAFFTPVVEAIRSVSPDRCIIAAMGGRGAPGKSMAALGVALTTLSIWPDEFHEDERNADDRNAFFASATWPYTSDGKTYDAESAMTNKQWGCDAPDKIAAVAKEYGVGFMIQAWAPTDSTELPERFNDACMEAYLNDFAAVLENRGYGWCYGDANSFVGLYRAYPSVASTTHTQVGSSPLYIDDEMLHWFQTLNAVH